MIDSTMMATQINRSWFAFLLVCAGGMSVLAGSSGPTVSTRVDSQDVFRGETFTFQIVVSGTDKVDNPDLTGLAKDFTVEFLGPRNNSSTQMSIINGQVNRTVTHEVLLVYRLTPKRVGTLTIPALSVKAGGKILLTRPISIRVREPMRMDDDTLHLEMSLSRDTVVVGEPVTVRWSWLIATKVRGFQVDLPLFGLDAFRFPVSHPTLDPRRRDQYLEIPRPDGKSIIAMKRQVNRQGKRMIELTFQQVVIPRRAGTFTLPETTIFSEVLAGVRQPTRRRSPFDDPFFDVFGRDRNEVYRRVKTVSNSLTLTVKPLPEKGRPKDFVGHVGHFRMHLTASPTDVNVGEPITVTIYVSGPEYLDDVESPPLEKQEELRRNFRISPPEPGVVQDNAKVFKRILRAKRPDVTRIPPLRLPYFDSRIGEYAVAETEPVPLHVKAVKVVTALDAEGNAGPVSSRGKKLKVWSRGIATNYEDLSALIDERVGLGTWLGTPALAAVVIVPPVVYGLVLLITVVVRRRRADPAALAARRALATARRALNAAQHRDAETHEAILDALREYFGAKLRLAPGAVVFQDVRDPLLERGIAPEDVEALGKLFEACEAGRYAGGAGMGDTGPELAAEAKNLLVRIDRRFG